MPAVSTTPPTEMSLAAMMLAVRRQVTNSAVNVTNRQLIMRGYASYVRQDGRRLLGDALGGGVVHVDLPIAHLQGIQRPRVLQRHVDLERDVAQRDRQER